MSIPHSARKRIISAAVIALASFTPPPIIAQSGDDLAAREAIGQNPLARPARLVVDGVPLEAALTALESRSGVSLFYSPSKLPRETVSCQCYSVTVDQALKRILTRVELRYSLHGQNVVIESSDQSTQQLQQPPPQLASHTAGNSAGLPLRTTRSSEAAVHDRGGPVAAVQGTITGRVIDAQTLQPLPSVQVFIDAVNMGTLTGPNGNYQLVDVPAGNHALRVQLIGYQAESRTVSVISGEAQAVNFELTEAALALDEIVVTGTPGGTQRRALGNVVSRVDAAVLEQAAGTGIEQAIGNTVTGVRMIAPAGAAGGAQSMRIRGSSSMALAGDPLIYVDGIRVNAEKAFDARGSATSMLQDIDPGSIESIEIIKGPAAATLYGTEAANGVIQIITKRGIAGAASFDASVELGANWQPHPEQNFGLQFYRDPVTDEIRSHNLYALEQSADRFGKPLFQNGPIQRYNASVRGGTDLFRYFASINRTDEEGFSRGDWTEGWRAQVSLTAIPRDGLSFTINSSRSARDTRDMGSVMCSYACWATPVTVDLPQRGAARPYEATLGGSEDLRVSDRVSWSAEVSHTPASWFRHRLVGGVDDSAVRRVSFTPKGANGFEEFFGTSGSDGLRSVWEVEAPIRTIDYAATATIQLTDRLASSSSVGLQWFNRQETELFSSGRNFAVPALSTVGAASERETTEEFIENTTLGTFFQNEFDWAGRLFLTGAVRFDDNSAFGTNYDAAIYPKLSGSWVISEESFFPQTSLTRYIDQFRLRAAWGESGQQPDAFAAQRLYTPLTGPNGQPMLTREAFGNPDLGPEKGSELEIGFDAAFLSERVTLDFTWYNRKTIDAIVSQPVRPSMGFDGTQFVNIGETRNWGTETGIGLQLLTGSPVRWDLDLGLTTMGNRIEDMGGTDQILVVALSGMPSRSQYHVEAFPIAGLFAKKVLSADFVSGNSGPVANLMCDGGKGLRGLEMGGVAVPCDEAPEVFFGQVDPSWQAYLRSSWTLGTNLRLSAALDAQGGHVMNADYLGGQNTRFSEKFIRRDDPIFQANSLVSRAADVIHDAGFAKLREITLHYTLPTALAARMGASTAGITASLYNVATLWIEQEHVQSGQRIWDPEMTSPNFNFSGIATGSPPPMSSATVRFNVSF
ncbi:MAG: SusC/RagA family TonB-linked outer membrane protein [Gemmatimonas sp.]|nr:SusC/RagA family TonB-linked outer membrane protein [Gemmatimonas sp.]